MDPGTIAAGIGAVTSLVGAIGGEATRKKRKKKFKDNARLDARTRLQREFAQQMGAPTYDLDATMENRKIDQAAEDNFQFDPMSFVPFAQSAAKVGQGVYDAASAPAEFQDSDGFQYDPEVMQKAQEDDERKARLARYAQGNPWGAYA